MSGRLALRQVSGNLIDGPDVCLMVARIAKTAQIPRHIRPHALEESVLDAA